ncbi:hypothetical protein D9758_014310 [Tetrapyrgos nigripes]|uniref:Uncharacterized protein n=1 Tax=Tetrapyrgos nigripes TaxID=182062 RepID=A0A8H5CA67_9AGAR|nr:hypothetical protein D9758_014310 [Tetrapyrgos nigripes]
MQHIQNDTQAMAEEDHSAAEICPFVPDLSHCGICKQKMRIPIGIGCCNSRFHAWCLTIRVCDWYGTFETRKEALNCPVCSNGDEFLFVDRQAIGCWFSQVYEGMTLEEVLDEIMRELEGVGWVCE